MTRDELIAELRASGAEALAAMESVPADALDNPGYEQGWTVRGIMAHVAAMEYAYRRLPDVARSPNRDAQTTPTGERFDIDAYNARQVEKRRAAAPAELQDEFARGRGALIATVARIEPELLTVPIRSAGGITGTLAEVIHITAVAHTREHAADFVRAAGGRQPAEPERLAAAIVLAAREARALVEGTTEEKWRAASDGAWSPAQICGHIAEMLPYWAEQARRALADPEARIGRSLDDPERLGGPARFEALASVAALAALDEAALRAAATIRGLPPESLDAPLRYRDGSETTIREALATRIVRHAHEHLDQLRATIDTA